MSSIPVWLQITVAVVSVLGGIFTIYIGAVKHISKKWDKDLGKVKEEAKAEIQNAVSRGREMVDSCEEKVELLEKYNTQKFKAIEEDVKTTRKDVVTLQSQQMTEYKVDSKLQPIKDDIDETREELAKVNENLTANMNNLSKEFKEHASLQEMNVQHLISGVSEIKGYLKAKSEMSGE